MVNLFGTDVPFYDRKKQVHVNSKTQLRKVGLVQRIAELAEDIQKLACEAVQQYSAEIEAILKMQNHNSRRIERCLDGMLDFCFDDRMLELYKKLCRYYFTILL